MRVAALDLGSNSFHLLVADVGAGGGTGGTLDALQRDKEMLRLGSRVAEDGRLGEEGMAAALAVVERFAAQAEALGADRVVACGTAALRRAADAGSMLERIRQATGIEVDIITGEEEARLIFAAVQARAALDGDLVLALDLGGGSLEMMIGDGDGLAWSASVELGVGRLTAEAVRSDPPSGEDRRRLADLVDGALEPHLAEVRARAPARAIGSSGTLTTLIALAANAAGADGEAAGSAGAGGPATAGLADLRAVEAMLMSQTSAARAALPGVEPRRADLLPAGIVVCVTVMDRAGVGSLTACDWALREGMVLDAARTAGTPGNRHPPGAGGPAGR